ncbi:MAG: plastocyanin/azurin family copper-binding protein, partial [Dehalococcoidia bacterium]
TASPDPCSRRMGQTGAMRTAIVILLGTLAALAIACSGESGTDLADLTPVANPVIDQESLAFEPNAVAVRVGGTVTFRNAETAIHTVNVDGENVSGEMERDATFEYTFGAVGTFEITCDYHAQMKATVSVVE